MHKTASVQFCTTQLNCMEIIQFENQNELQNWLRKSTYQEVTGMLQKAE